MYDQHMNVLWPLTHYSNATKYLISGDEVVSSTGGTNWKKYLPPMFQKLSFFPFLWTSQEKEEWGKLYVDRLLKN